MFGGWEGSNSLRNSGGFDQRVKEMLSTKCPSDDAAPASLVYEFSGLGWGCRGEKRRERVRFGYGCGGQRKVRQ